MLEAYNFYWQIFQRPFFPLIPQPNYSNNFILLQFIELWDFRRDCRADLVVPNFNMKNQVSENLSSLTKQGIGPGCQGFQVSTLCSIP